MGQVASQLVSRFQRGAPARDPAVPQANAPARHLLPPLILAARAGDAQRASTALRAIQSAVLRPWQSEIRNMLLISNRKSAMNRANYTHDTSVPTDVTRAKIGPFLTPKNIDPALSGNIDVTASPQALSVLAAAVHSALSAALFEHDGPTPHLQLAEHLLNQCTSETRRLLHAIEQPDRRPGEGTLLVQSIVRQNNTDMVQMMLDTGATTNRLSCVRAMHASLDGRTHAAITWLLLNRCDAAFWSGNSRVLWLFAEAVERLAFENAAQFLSAGPHASGSQRLRMLADALKPNSMYAPLWGHAMRAVASDDATAFNIPASRAAYWQPRYPQEVARIWTFAVWRWDVPTLTWLIRRIGMRVTADAVHAAARKWLQGSELVYDFDFLRRMVESTAHSVILITPEFTESVESFALHARWNRVMVLLQYGRVI